MSETAYMLAISSDLMRIAGALERIAGFLEPQAVVESECRWVPVSERVPEVEGWYTVKLSRDHAPRTDYWNTLGWDAYLHITHWLEGVPPLPEGE